MITLHTCPVSGSLTFAFEIVRVLGDSRHVPLLGHDLLMRRCIIADQDQDLHDDMFSDRDDVGTGDFGNGNLPLVGRVEVDVVGTDTSSLTQLEVLGFRDDLTGQVRRMERRRDEHVGVDNVLLELAVLAFLVGSYHEVPATLFAERSETQSVLRGAQELGLLAAARERQKKKWGAREGAAKNSSAR